MTGREGNIGSQLTKLDLVGLHQLNQAIVDTVREPLIVMDGELKILAASRNFYKIFMVSPEATVGHKLYELGNGQWDIAPLRQILIEVLEKQENIEGYEVDHIFPKIGHKVMLLNARKIFFKSQNTKMILLALEDITERKKAQAEIKRLAMTDSLTGLANRNQFNERFQQSISLARREGKHLAIMVLDLDNFKQVNDTFGHPTGDALLVKVAEILQKHCRETDVVGRLGGDEFVILVVHYEDDTNVKSIAERIIADLQSPIFIMGNEIRIGISIGISIFSHDDGKELIRKADLALYEAKKRGRNCYRVHSDEFEN